MVEREPEAVGEVLLHLPHPRAILGHRHRRFSAAASWAGVPCSSVAPEKQHYVAAGASVAGVEVGGQLRADEIAEVLGCG